MKSEALRWKTTLAAVIALILQGLGRAAEPRPILLPIAPQFTTGGSAGIRKAAWNPAQRPCAEPPPSRKASLKDSAPPALKPAAPLSDITEAGADPEGFRTLGIKRAKGFLVTTAQRALTAADAAHAVSIKQVGYDGSKPLGQRTTYEAKLADGTVFQFKSSPLVFALSKKPLATRAQEIRYDIAGIGREQRILDVAEGGGVLVFDADKDGVSGADGRELFGDNTDLDGDGKKDGYKDGFAALNALAEKAVGEGLLPESVIERRRLDAQDLLRLEAAYGLKMKAGSLLAKPISLAEAGVAWIALSTERTSRVRSFDGRGNDAAYRPGAYFYRADGSRGLYADFWFALRSDKPAGTARLKPLPAWKS